jgi:type II secretion system protein N
MTPERLQRLRRIGGRAVFFVVVFAIAVVFSFPFDRIKDLAVAWASTQNLDLEIGAAGPTFGAGVSLSDIRLQTRPTDGKKPARILIPAATVTLSPFAKVLGRTAVSISAEALGGEIDADIDTAKARGLVKIKTRQIAMAELPGVREAVNLPLGGNLDLTVDMAFPQNKNAEAAGSFSWKCAGCVVGDGKEKLKVPGSPLLAEGITLPRIRLGDFVGKVSFEKGHGKLQAVQAKSPDGELYLEGEIRLADPVKYSSVDLYVRFKFSEALLKSSDKLKLILQFAESAGKRPDGTFGFRMQGSLSNLGSVQWMKTSPFAGPAAAPARPMGARAPGPARSAAAVIEARPPPASPDPTPPPAAGDAVEATTAGGLRAVDPATDPNANLPKYATDPQPAPQPVQPTP